MNYKVGDVVKIRDDLTYDEKHSQDIGWAPRMDKYCGEVHEICYVGSDYYNLKDVCEGTVNSNGYWMFVDDWLEPVNEIKFELTENELIDLISGIR